MWISGWGGGGAGVSEFSYYESKYKIKLGGGEVG